jgi:7-cyano-7-deazaguanine synthase
VSKVILLSGGLDSALCLARYGADLAIGFNYGQPHAIELAHAERIARQHGVPFEIHALPTMPRVNDVVFAGRNAVMLTAAAAIAQARGHDAVLIGCNFSDATRFPDCRPEFIRNISKALESAYGVSVCAPLLLSTKTQIVAEAKQRGITDTWTCYAPTTDGQQCGQCYSCQGIASASAS